ncbi:MAG: hypothetical protein U1F42_06945 [Candidatus Competibacteraceae bacterium]
MQTLEQYSEDTLENLDIEETEPNPATWLSTTRLRSAHRLHRESRAVYCAIERFASPFGYMKRAAGGGGVTANR